MSELNIPPVTPQKAFSVLLDCADAAEGTWFEDVYRMGAEAIRRAQPENERLTLKELRGMGGEPVWIVGQTFARWEILRSFGKGHDPDLCHFTEILPLRISDYGDTWFAYRRKPERSEG